MSIWPHDRSYWHYRGPSPSRNVRRDIAVAMTAFGLATAVAISPCPAEERVNVLPEIVIGGGPSGSAAPVTDRCVEVEIGSSRAMDCINQKLKREVDRVNPSLNLPPIDAKSQDLKVGTVNIPAVHQQYGKNFGVSAYPYRPPAPVFTSPTGRH